MDLELLTKDMEREVFERDEFTCQYCGAQPPEVVLEIDHVDPETPNSPNPLFHFVTVCQPCKAGIVEGLEPGVRVIEDIPADQDAALQERKRQIDMVFQWQRALIEIDKHIMGQFASIWSELVKPYRLTRSGVKDLSRLREKFGDQEVIVAMRVAAEHYVQYDGDDPTEESVNNAWSKVAGVCYNRLKDRDEEQRKSKYYIRAILRNRGLYVQDETALNLISRALELGVSRDEIKVHAVDARNWTIWKTMMEECIADKIEENEQESETGF